MNPLIHFLISSPRVRVAWLQSFSQNFHKSKKMYVEFFFPLIGSHVLLWFWRTVLVVIRIITMPTVTTAKPICFQAEVEYGLRHQGAGFWYLTQLLTAMDLGQVTFLSVPPFPFLIGKNNSTYLKDCFEDEIALHIWTNVQKVPGIIVSVRYHVYYQ